MLHPATARAKEKKPIEEGAVSTKNDENGREILELDDDSDIEGDGDDAKETSVSNDLKEKKSTKREIDI